MNTPRRNRAKQLCARCHAAFLKGIGLEDLCSRGFILYLTYPEGLRVTNIKDICRNTHAHESDRYCNSWRKNQRHGLFGYFLFFEKKSQKNLLKKNENSPRTRQFSECPLGWTCRKILHGLSRRPHEHVHSSLRCNQGARLDGECARAVVPQRPDTSCAHSMESRQAQANGAAM